LENGRRKKTIHDEVPELKKPDELGQRKEDWRDFE